MLTLIGLLLLAAIVVGGIGHLPYLDGAIVQIIRVVVVVALVVYVLVYFGLLPHGWIRPSRL